MQANIAAVDRPISPLQMIHLYIAVAGDIQDESHCKHLVERTVSEFGKIDILVNNAAFQMARESFERFLPKSLTAPLRRISMRHPTSQKPPRHTCRRAAQ